MNQAASLATLSGIYAVISRCMRGKDALSGVVSYGKTSPESFARSWTDEAITASLEVTRALVRSRIIHHRHYQIVVGGVEH